MNDILSQLEKSGFKVAENVDEEFPPIKGEYKAHVTVARPAEDRETKEQTGYQVSFKIDQTLSGDVADNRLLTKWYRLAGTKFNGEALTTEEKIEAMKALCNDAFTMGVELDRSATPALEASLVHLIERPCYLRAWHFAAKDDPDRRVQQFVIKQERHLRKDSKESAAGGTGGLRGFDSIPTRAPF